jgi:hypothetical protein
MELGELMKKVDPRNLSGLIAQLADWVRGFADGHRMTIFKDVKPTAMEELLIAETGKTLYLPSTLGEFPKVDPFPRKRIITEDVFRRYLESTGTDPKFLDDAVARFIRKKFDAGYFSDAWVPIQFHQYVVGYIHLWINQEGKVPFSFEVIDTAHQFASVLAFSLKENGFFESGRLKNEAFEGQIVDISVSGVLFAYPFSTLSTVLVQDSELAVTIVTPHRSVTANAQIARQFKDGSRGYYGCRFLEMAPEDVRFLFEYIYGRPFTDSDATFLAGQV